MWTWKTTDQIGSIIYENRHEHKKKTKKKRKFKFL